jgi:threonylcarbamoyladenosine tRNA methylthiotransferase MtaB
MGRTEGFTEVTFTAPQPVGQIVSAKISGVAGRQLVA